MTCVLRRLYANDIDGVMALAAQVPEAPQWKREEYERCAGEESATLRRIGFVAENQGRLLGFSVGKLVAGVCELESIAVIPEARGRGIGRSLFEAVTNWAQAQGAVHVELEVRSSNLSAIRLY